MNVTTCVVVGVAVLGLVADVEVDVVVVVVGVKYALSDVLARREDVVCRKA